MANAGQGTNPWDLDGDRTIFQSKRTQKDEQWTSEAFTLKQGVVMFRVAHNGHGECKVELARTSPGFFDNDLTLFEFRGKLWGQMAWVVTPGEWRAPRPNEEYQLVVEASGNWRVRMLQPDLGQTRTTIPFSVTGVEGVHLFGPIQNLGRPLIAKARHNARGHFYLRALPLDGSREANTFITQEGQVYVSDYPTDMIPGKEYLIQVGANGEWDLEFSEGY